MEQKLHDVEVANALTRSVMHCEITNIYVNARRLTGVENTYSEILDFISKIDSINAI